MIRNGSSSTTPTLVPSRPCRSRQPERALRSWAAYITPRPAGTPSSTWGFVFSETHQLITAVACSWCAAFAAFGYEISGPTLGSQQHIRGHTFIRCAPSEPSATSSLSRCWGVCISRWHNLCQKIPRQLHSTWIQREITVLCQPPHKSSPPNFHAVVFAS